MDDETNIMKIFFSKSLQKNLLRMGVYLWSGG